MEGFAPWWTAVLSLKTLWVLLHLVSCHSDESNSRETSRHNMSYLEDTQEWHIGYSNNVWNSPTRLRSNRGRHRTKRGVIELYNMLMCSTSCDPLAYKGYGCYCGFLGSGYTVDGIDRCCKMHDWCYNTAECPMFLEYFVPYLWKCYRHHPLCAVEQDGLCAYRLCECDRLFAECLRRYPCPTSKAVCTSSPWRLLQNIFML